MDRFTHHQTQLQYIRTEKEQDAEIRRGRGRLFDGQDVTASTERSITPEVPSRCRHTTYDWSMEQENVSTACG